MIGAKRIEVGWVLLAQLLALLAGSGCYLMTQPPEIDPETNFAAYRDDDGLVIDRVVGGGKGRVEDARCDVFCTGPQLILRLNGETQAGFWVGATTTVVRAGTDTGAARLGEVEARWDGDAVRLRLVPEDGQALESGIFPRIAGGYAPLSLGQPVEMTIDTSGVYRASLVAADGDTDGWLRVRLRMRESPSRIYDGVLPPSIAPALAAAAVARLDAVIDSTEADAIDPYLGN